MSNIKNFGLYGVGSDVQFGKGGVRLAANAATLSVLAANSTANTVVYAPLKIGAPSASTDAATKNYVDTAISGLGAPFDYVGTVSGDVQATPTDLSLLAKTDTGSYYKVAADGYFTFSGVAFFAKAGDGLVFNSAGGVDRLDNVDAAVSGTADYIAVTGSADTGFTVDLDAAFKSRVSNVEVNLSTLSNTSASAISSINGNIATVANAVANAQAEVDAIEGAVGLSTSGEYVANVSTTYIGSVSTVVEAAEALDRAIAEIAAAPYENLIISPDSNVTVYANNTDVTIGTATANVTITYESNAVVFTAGGAAGDVSIVLDPKGTGVIDVSGSVVADVADPVSMSDGANKGYVDAAFAAQPFVRQKVVTATGVGTSVPVEGKITQVRVRIKDTTTEGVEVWRGTPGSGILLLDSDSIDTTEQDAVFIVDVMDTYTIGADVYVEFDPGEETKEIEFSFYYHTDASIV